MLDVDNRSGTIQRRYLAVVDTKKLVNKLVNLNLKLFFNLSDAEALMDWLSDDDSKSGGRKFSSVTAGTTVIGPPDVIQKESSDMRRSLAVH